MIKSKVLATVVISVAFIFLFLLHMNCTNNNVLTIKKNKIYLVYTEARSSEGLSSGDFGDVKIIDVETGEDMKITNDGFYETEPIISPDNSKIIYLCNRESSLSNSQILDLGSERFLYLYDIKTNMTRKIAPFWERDKKPFKSGYLNTLFFANNDNIVFAKGFNIYNYNFVQDRLSKLYTIDSLEVEAISDIPGAIRSVDVSRIDFRNNNNELLVLVENMSINKSYLLKVNISTKEKNVCVFDNYVSCTNIVNDTCIILQKKMFGTDYVSIFKLDIKKMKSVFVDSVEMKNANIGVVKSKNSYWNNKIYYIKFIENGNEHFSEIFEYNLLAKRERKITDSKRDLSF